jgi:hypothetical protein
MNKESIAADAQHLHMPGLLNTISEIEEYTNYLMNFLQQLMELTVPLAKLKREYICSWWTPEIKSAVQQARATRRQGGGAEHLRAAIQNKRKVIRKAKTAKFREEVHKTATAASSKSIWRFVR